MAKASPEPRSPAKTGGDKAGPGPSWEGSQSPVRGPGVRYSPSMAGQGWAEARWGVSLWVWVRISGAHGQAQAQLHLPPSRSSSRGSSTTDASKCKGLKITLLYKQRNIVIYTQEKMTTCFVSVLFGTQNLTKTKTKQKKSHYLDGHKNDIGEMSSHVIPENIQGQAGRRS